MKTIGEKFYQTVNENIYPIIYIVVVAVTVVIIAANTLS